MYLLTVYKSMTKGIVCHFSQFLCSMRISRTLQAGILVAVLAAMVSADDKDEKKKKLQIGVKKRVDPDKCTIKSRKGDVLKMHYTVSRGMQLLKLGNSCF